MDEEGMERSRRRGAEVDGDVEGKEDVGGGEQ